jgi:uncharacterized protein
MTQTWYDLLFVHWPIDASSLRSLVPNFLEIDTFHETAWIGVIPLGMRNIHFRNLPPIPFTSQFLELNVRTYVRSGEKRGVYFFSLDAANPLAVEVARTSYFLPYFNATMMHSCKGEDIVFKSERTDRRGKKCIFDASYRPIAEAQLTGKGTIEEWLTERYRLFTCSSTGKPKVAEIHHKQWSLQKAKAEIRANSMTEALGIKLPDTPPLLHFAKEMETLEWAIKSFERVGN